MSPAVRERLGIVCAVGAVACLASIIVHWSRQYPVERSPLEQDLFGDLADDDAESAAASPAELPTHSSAPAAALRTIPHKPDDEEPILVEVAPNPVHPRSAMRITAGDGEPADEFIQPVIHEQPSSATSVWLSGGIEVDADDASSIPPVTITLP